MITLRQAAELALASMEGTCDSLIGTNLRTLRERAAELRAALSEPDQHWTNRRVNEDGVELVDCVHCGATHVGDGSSETDPVQEAAEIIRDYHRCAEYEVPPVIGTMNRATNWLVKHGRGE